MSSETHIQGSYNRVVNIEYQREKAVYNEPNLEKCKPPWFSTPKISNTLVEIIRGQHFLILDTEHLSDRQWFVRNLAWLVSEQVISEQTHEELEVREWWRDSGLQQLQYALETESTPCIWILPEIHPKDLSFNYPAVAEFFQRTGHYGLAYTQSPARDWRLSNDDLWFSINDRIAYEPIALYEHFQDLVKLSMDEIPCMEGEQDTTRKFSESVEHIIKGGLRAPSMVPALINFLKQDPHRLGEKELHTFFRRQQKHQPLRNLYQNQHRDRARHLAVGLCMFDGLEGFQFFSALDIWVDKIVRTRHPNLLSFDYDDLQEFPDFFSPGDGEIVIEAPNNETRRELLSWVWQHQRQNLLVSLPFLIELIEMSAESRFKTKSGQAPSSVLDEESLHWLRDGIGREIIATETRRRKLRLCLTNLFKEIGYLSPETMRSPLLRLLVNPNMEIRGVAAQAIASWRERNPELTVKSLKRLREDSKLLYQTEMYIKQKGDKKDARTWLSTGLAQIVAFAGTFDLPNRLQPYLCELVYELGRETNSHIRDVFNRAAVPTLVFHHAQQLNQLLDQWIMYSDRLPFVAMGLARHTGKNLEGVYQVLSRWREQASMIHASNIHQNPGKHEAFLATISLTHGYLSRSPWFEPEKALADWSEILSHEKHPFLRSSVFDALFLWASKNFSAFTDHFTPLTKLIHEAELSQLSQLFNDLILKQRASLEGGDLWFLYKGQKYRIWLHENRPLTEAEQIFGNWSRQKTGRLSKLATLILNQFQQQFENAAAAFKAQHQGRQPTLPPPDKPRGAWQMPIEATPEDPPQTDYIEQFLVFFLAKNKTDRQQLKRYLAYRKQENIRASAMVKRLEKDPTWSHLTQSFSDIHKFKRVIEFGPLVILFLTGLVFILKKLFG